MISLLKELWTTLPSWMKGFAVLCIVGAGWLGFRMTATDPQVIAKAGELERILARPIESAVGRIGRVLYTDLHKNLKKLYQSGDYKTLSSYLHQSLTPKPPFSPQLSASDIRAFQWLKAAKPTSLKVVSMAMFNQTRQKVLATVPLKTRKPSYCVDATALEPRNQCAAGLTISWILATNRTWFRGSLPRLMWPLVPDKSFDCGIGKRGSGSHGGVDISAMEGTKLWAMGSGVVKSVGRSPQGSCGYSIRIVYDLGFESLYCHMQFASPKSAGQRVRQGDFVGRVGKTGNSRGAHPYHLHLVVWDLKPARKLLRDPIAQVILCQ